MPYPLTLATMLQRSRLLIMRDRFKEKRFA